MFFERGKYDRVFFARLRADEDLVTGIEALCREAGFGHAVIRGSLGSVNYATFKVGERIIHVPHMGLEITALYGEIREGKANLTGSVVNGAGEVFSGHFVSGKNPICVTAEITVEEWVPE
ncbi:MAG: PPC domain-containing DNA-binding protein [Hyphomicrobiales bacterium]